LSKASSLVSDDATLTSDYESLGDSDEERESDGNLSESALVDSLPQNTKVIVTYDVPPFWRVRIVAELVFLLAQVGLGLFKFMTWRSVFILGNLLWVYLLVLALVRLKRERNPGGLWTHSALLYTFTWPVSLALLRSAIIGGNDFIRNIQIANFSFATALVLIVLTSRPGNKPVNLVSTNNLEPTRV